MGRESRRVAQRARIGDNGCLMTLAERIRRRGAALDWPALESGLDGRGDARLASFLHALVPACSLFEGHQFRLAGGNVADHAHSIGVISDH